MLDADVSRIVVEPGRRSGHSVVRGTRIAVADVLDMLAAGMSTDEVLSDFPELTREDVLACWRALAMLQPSRA